jgi:MerR family transcriptional regulator, heat shock protein HspR
MTVYTRRQIVELLAIDEDFIAALEREDIVRTDAPETRFSTTMLERIRAADTLVHELDVNLPGVSVILRMREELATVRRRLQALAVVGAPRRGH